MTPVPQLDGRTEVTTGDNWPEFRPFGRVARRLLAIVLMACVHTVTVLGPAAVVGGCVFPPPLEIGDPDAGPNATPVIVSANSEFAFHEPIYFEEDENRTITLTLEDTDIEDQLFVKLYVDWFTSNPTPALSECTVQQSVDSTMRTADCPTQSLCSTIDDTMAHQLEAMVADRAFLNQGEPEFRALPEGAAFSFRSWQMYCPMAEM